MPTDANGQYSLPPGYFATPNTPILTSQHNPIFEDVAQALTDRLPRNGTAPMTGELILSSASPVALLAAVPKTYVDKKGPTYWGGTSTGTANAQAVATSLASFSLTAGSRLTFIPGFTNTDAATLAVDGGTATAIKKLSPFGLLPLTGSEIIVGQVADVVYDGTQFVLLNNARTNGRPATVNANTTFTASDIGRFLIFTGGTTVTATLPTPPSNGSFTVWNSSTVVQNLSTGSGVFSGPGGTGTNALVVQIGETLILASDGTNWVVTFRYPPKVRVTVPKRQTVLSGPADANGLPTFFPATSANLTLTMQNVASGTALVATIANGFDSSGQFDLGVRVTTNLAVNVNASSTSYIWLDDTGTLGVAALAPIYQYGGSASVTNGQHTYIIGQGQMYVGNGTTASAVNRVFIGEAVASGSAITSTVAYAYQRFYRYVDTGSFPTGGTAVSKAHNIGTSVGIVGTLGLVCAVAEGGFNVGDVVAHIGMASAGPWYAPLSLGLDNYNAKFGSGSNVAFLIANPTNGTVLTAPTLSRWRYAIQVSSSW